MKSAVEYLCVFPSIFIKSGRKFSFRNPMFSYLIAPLMAGFDFQYLFSTFDKAKSLCKLHYHQRHKDEAKADEIKLAGQADDTEENGQRCK